MVLFDGAELLSPRVFVRGNSAVPGERVPRQFLRILTGLLSLSGGSVRIDGLDVSRDPALVKERIGYMSQRFSLSETLTVAENLLYVSEVWQVPHGERRKRIARLLQFSRLGPFQDRLTAPVH